MAIIKATCPTCGPTELTTREVQLQECTAIEETTYSFLCHLCHLIVNKVADKDNVRLLIEAGVRVVTWDLPAELSELKVGPPIAYDDLLAFHFELDQEASIVLGSLKLNNESTDQQTEY